MKNNIIFFIILSFILISSSIYAQDRSYYSISIKDPKTGNLDKISVHQENKKTWRIKRHINHREVQSKSIQEVHALQIASRTDLFLEENKKSAKQFSCPSTFEVFAQTKTHPSKLVKGCIKNKKTEISHLFYSYLELFYE